MNSIDIANLLGIKHGKISVEITTLLTDSRNVSFAENTLFFCIETQRGDGHKYIEDLYRKGVRCFVVSEIPTPLHDDALYIEVTDTTAALQQLASFVRTQFHGDVVGITGSNGKTIVKEWLYTLIAPSEKVIRSPRSFNSQIGVPLSLWLLDDTARIALIEAGISQKGEMEHLQKIIAPDIGLFTSIGEAHQENFASMKEKCMEKMKLFAQVDTLIYRKDDKLIDICAEQTLEKHVKRFTWGESAMCDVQLKHVITESDGALLDYRYKGGSYSAKIHYSDKASIENAMLCITFLLYKGFEPAYIAEHSETLPQLSMRMEINQGVNDCIVINDSWSSDLNALEVAMDAMGQMNKDKNKTIVLSDIEQSGLSHHELYRRVAELLAHKNITRLIGVGEQISAQKDCFDNIPHTDFYTTTAALIDAHLTFRNEAILIKGARRFGLEKFSRTIESFSHQTSLYVNLSALIENYRYYRSFLHTGTKMVCMVKADAYGCGAIEISRALVNAGVEYLAVAVADEGVRLREAGIGCPIMVMNPERHSLSLLTEYHLEPEIYDFEILEDFIKEAESQGLHQHPIHIKIDSGMHRLGFNPEDLEKLILRLKKTDAVSVRSVFSHLVGADCEDFDAFTRRQIDLTDCASRQITDAFPSNKILRHILNSAGIERFSDSQWDMVRLGIGLYGMNVGERKLRPVCSLHSTILQIRDIKKGESVGYSRKWTAPRDSKIATIPIGYADGLRRSLGNGNWNVVLRGVKAPIVGNICMDIAMVDVTNCDAQVGDDVEIFGGNARLEDMAEKCGTITYEILTGIAPRVKKIYYLE